MLKYIWKKDGSLYKTTTYFARWRVVCRMEARYRDMFSLHEFTKRKMGPSCILSLLQNICECVRHLAITDTGQTEGLWVITDKLDKIYLRDKHTMAYTAFKEFYLYKRTAGVNINNFLVWHEFCVSKIIWIWNYLVRSLGLFLYWMWQMNQ